MNQNPSGEAAIIQWIQAWAILRSGCGVSCPTIEDVRLAASRYGISDETTYAAIRKATESGQLHFDTEMRLANGPR